jgi:hypothetical protein
MAIAQGEPKSAAERDGQELMVLRFASEYCTDGARAINSFEPAGRRP